MRRSRSPLTKIAALAAGVVLLLVSDAPQVAAQKRPLPPGVETAEESGPKPEGYQQFTLPDDRDARERLKAVMDYLVKKSVPWDVVGGTAQQLLDAKSDSFFSPQDAAGRDTSSLVSVKAKVNDLIGAFPKEGRQFYELTYGPAADALLKEAVRDRYDRPALADVSQRYFHTRAGAQAALLLAGLDLDAGNYAEAAYGFQRLLDRPDGGDALSPRTLFRAALAFKRGGDPRQGEAVAKLWDRLEKSFPRDGLTVGRRAFALDDLRRELDRPGMAPAPLGDGLVTGRYGNPSHTGRADAGTPFLDPYPAPIPLLYQTENRTGNTMGEAAEWIRQNRAEALKHLDRGKGQVSLPGFFPVTAPNLILCRTYDGVYAFVARDGYVGFPGTASERAFRSGDLLWYSGETTLEGGIQAALGGLSGLHSPVAAWWQNYWRQAMPTLLFENAQVGSLSHDGKLVYAVDDLTLPPPPPLVNPNLGGFQPPPAGGGNDPPLAGHSRLVALHIGTGRQAWALGGRAAGPPADPEDTADAGRLTEDSFFLGPPLSVNGKLYVLFERNAQIKLACLDPHRLVKPGGQGPPRPDLLWVQALGAPNTRLGQDALRRVQPAYLAYADGVLVCPTNSGAVVAVDINARRLLWARYYGSAPPPDPFAGGGGGRPFRGGMVVPHPMAGQALPLDRWRAAAPIIAGGKVVFAAHDSNKLQCLDLRTGADVWSAPRRPDDLYVGGVIGDKVLVVGKDAVRAYALAGGPDREPAVAWQSLRTGTPCGHGVAGKDGLYYLPMVGRPDQKDSKEPQVWAIDAAAGTVRSMPAYRRKDGAPDDPRLALGNLVFHEGQLFAQSASDLTAFPLLELKKQEMARLLAADPKDPAGLADRGELSLDNGDLRDAVADFKEAEAHDPPEAVRRRIRQKLYAAYTQLLRADFAAGEPFLAEYEALCDLPTDADDPAEKQRLMDEQVRRRGLYLTLVARGREKQGRLAEAFDLYRRFADLGDNKQLVEVDGEPGAEFLPQVWARGRIDGLFRAAADPAAKRALAGRLRAEWEAVAAGNDLARLRAFVRVFGPTGPAGPAAPLLLADRLLQTNNEDDLREAQGLAAQVRAAAEDDATGAKALDLLARVLTRRGMPDDAVGLYAQLGARYPDVAVRDGKTGADIYAEVVTDKRLLPYLEPARGAAAGPYRVEVPVGPVNRPFALSFAVRPDGDLYPFFRRFQLVLEAAQPGSPAWVLRVTDRATGEDRCKFTDLGPVQPAAGGVNQGGVPSYRIAQADGHLLLLTLGQFVYCLDVAEKRELWRYNLLGAGPPAAAAPPGVTVEADGDVAFSYEDGWTLRLGRAAVLQPTYVALVTRDGLVALDPATGQKLWVRSNVGRRVQVFGDARHLFVVEGSAGRVLRAADGATVDGAKEVAGLLTGPARVGVFGRRVLLSEGGGDGPRVLRLADLLTAADVWKKEYPAGSVLLKTTDPELTGCLAPDGAFEVLESRTGKAVFAGGALDPDRRDDHLARVRAGRAAVSPVLLADADRFYLFLNRPPDPARPVMTENQSVIRSLPVNGVAYAFDRATGKRLWYSDRFPEAARLFGNQKVLLDRFEDLPVIVAAAAVLDDKLQTWVYQVVVVDKQTGKLRYKGDHPNGNAFLSVSADPKTRAVEFWRHDFRVRVVPADGPKAEVGAGR